MGLQDNRATDCAGHGALSRALLAVLCCLALAAAGLPLPQAQAADDETPIAAGTEAPSHIELDRWLPVSALSGASGLAVTVDGSVYDDIDASFGTFGGEQTTLSLASRGLSEAGYELWYRVRLKWVGVLGWAHDGQQSGMKGCAAPIAAVRVHVSRVGDAAPGDTANHLASLPKVKYRVKTIGGRAGTWKAAGKTAGSTKGTAGTSELAVRVSSGFSGKASYTVANRWGQEKTAKDGKWAGWNGGQQQLNLQYARVRLTGDLGKRFTLWYRAHGSDGRWHGWTRAGRRAGTTGLFAKTGAVQMRVLPKGAPAPGTTARPLVGDKTRAYKIDGRYKAKKSRRHNLSKRPKGARGVKYICVHFTDDGSSKKGSAFANCQFFRRANRGRSADFFIDDGTIARYNPDCAKWYSWAVGDGRGKHGIWNRNSISIEVCMSGNRRFTRAERLRLRYLVRWLMREYHVDEGHVARHYDASRKWCPQWYTPGGRGGTAGWKALKRYLMA